MKATIAKKNDRIAAILMPNPDQKYLIEIAPSKTLKLEQVDFKNSLFNDNESALEVLIKLGANISSKKDKNNPNKKKS